MGEVEEQGDGLGDPRAHASVRLDLLANVLDDLPAHLGLIRQHVAEGRGSYRAQRAAYELTGKVHGLLTRLRHDAFVESEEALEAAEELAGAGHHERARELRAQARAVRTGIDAHRETLAAVLEDTRRLEHQRLERNQRVVGYALAALTGIMALGLVVGEMGPADIAASLAQLPGPLAWSSGALVALHPWLVLTAVVGAAGLTLLLLVALVRAALPTRERGTDPVAVVGSSLMPLRELHAEALGTQGAPGGAAERLALLDRQAIDHLLPALEALRTAVHRADGDLEERIDAFLIRAELGARRPVPLLLPGTAALLRYGLEPGAPGRWLGSAEMASALEAGGSATTVEELDARAGQLLPDQLDQVAAFARGAI